MVKFKLNTRIKEKLTRPALSAVRTSHACRDDYLTEEHVYRPTIVRISLVIRR